MSGFGTVGASAKIDVNAAEAGDYRLALRYANGPNPSEGPKTVTLIVNGESRQITLPSTGTWPTYRLYVDDVTLDAGANTIEITHADGDVGHVNLDSLRLAPAGVTRYEAEAATLGGGASVQTEHAGYSGEGYVGGFQNQGASATFEVIALADAATEIELGYVNGPNPAPGTKEVSLYVNDQFVKKLALPSTGAWTDYGTFTDTLMLRAGSNDVSIRFDAGDDGNVNLDYLDVTQNEPVQCGTAVDPDDEFDGEALDRCRWTTVVNEDPSGYSLADGRLQIEAQEGDIVGGTFTARNVLLQQAPAGGSWAARTTLSIDGTDDYVQAGLIAPRHGHRVGQARRDAQPAGPVGARAGPRVGLAEQPAAARRRAAGITLELFASEGRLRGRYSLDDGATWTEVGAGFALSGLSAPGIGLGRVQRHRRGGGHASSASPSASRRSIPRRARPRRPTRATRCCSTGRGRAPRTGRWPDRARSPAPPTARCSPRAGSDCCGTPRRSTTRTRSSSTGRWRATTTRACSWASPLRARTRGSRSTTATRSRSTPRTTPTARPGRSTTSRRRTPPARDAVLNPPGEWNSYELVVEGKRIRIYLNGALINDFTSTDPERMAMPSFIGLQNHGNGDDVWFRDVQIRDLSAPVLRESTTTATADPRR